MESGAPEAPAFAPCQQARPLQRFLHPGVAQLDPVFFAQLLVEMPDVQIEIHFLIQSQHLLHSGQRDPLVTRLALAPVDQPGIPVRFQPLPPTPHRPIRHADDLGRVQVRERRPLESTYRGHRVASMPLPPSAGTFRTDGPTFVVLLVGLSHVIDGERLLSTIRRISLVANERTRAVRFDFAPGKLTVSSTNPELGDARETVPIDYSGNPFFVGELVRVRGARVDEARRDRAHVRLVTDEQDDLPILR